MPGPNGDNHAKVVIIGGGIIGLSVAYHLAELGWNDVLLLERNVLTSGTSWHAAGIVGPLRANMNLTKLAIYATELFGQLEQLTGQATGYKQTGGLWLAQSPQRMTELRRLAAMGELNGLHVNVLSAEQATAKMPLLHSSDLAGALWIDEDGQTNPVDTCLAYAKGARNKGVRIREHTEVVAIDCARGAVHAVHTAEGNAIRCDCIVNCAGLWARQVGALANVGVPLHAVEHMYVVTEPIDTLPRPCPVMRDLEGRIYIKEDAGKLVIGGFEANAKLWQPATDGSEHSYLMFPEDWNQFEPFLEAALRRLPILQYTGIQHFMNGPESFTPDSRQLMGEAPNLRNYFVAAGFNSIGIMSSAGVGKTLAQWIVQGEAPIDLWPVDLTRADPLWSNDEFLAARTQEAVANQFNMHWPHKQMNSGRDLRRSILHDAFARAGAVFGAPTGWERPLWFARSSEEREIRYSYDNQAWWPYAERETHNLQHHVALFELSPFTKLKITGAGAESFLQRLCTNDIARQPGRIVYSLLLNRRGKIEAEVTVRRISNQEFWIISGAATRWKDRAWIQRQINADDHVNVTDITDDYAVLGLMGPESRRLLQSLCCDDLSAVEFPFSTARTLRIGTVPIIAQRMSFVGELGYELYISRNGAQQVYDAIDDAGRAYGLGCAGHFCLDACRMEKGFKHWGHDLSADDSPLEADVEFAVRWDKPGGFIGRDAIVAQRSTGVTRRLQLFAVDTGHPLLLHDEPIYRDKRIAGITTSGARGFRTGLSLCFGYVECRPGQTRDESYAGRYEVGIAGERYALTALREVPYDPTGSRMRG
ncbi:MAG: FAD-dependent oxidoreductase [Gammaproteobacteria bacterium]|nr:FAD-dependent oxidoreductase [Gammaproteobacteria bacterium]MDH3464813.1 FAD-dependent oxidoreductase [Gammaproteobacteria bacterium]